MPTKHCTWGWCTSDSRQKNKLEMQRIKFYPFPKPKSDMSRCLKWIKFCGRPHDQLSVSKIKRHHVVCSKVRLCDNIKAFVLPGVCIPCTVPMAAKNDMQSPCLLGLYLRSRTILPSRTILDRTYSAQRFSIISLIFSFYFGSCGRLSWLNCQLSSAR